MRFSEINFRRISLCDCDQHVVFRIFSGFPRSDRNLTGIFGHTGSDVSLFVGLWMRVPGVGGEAGVVFNTDFAGGWG